MAFKTLELSDKKIFDEFFKRFPPKISELTFTNLFSWRTSKDYMFNLLDEHLIISFENEFLQPIGKTPEKIMEKLLKEKKDMIFERIEKSVAMLLSNKFLVEEERDMFDYVYSLRDLSELKGNQFEPKRNLVKQAEKYNPEVCRLTESNVNDFFRLQQEWCNLRSCENNKLLSDENKAILEALSNFKEFNLCGTCIRIKGKLAAFAIGEKLNEDTYVEHFEKGDLNYKGIYQYVLKEFASALSEKTVYLNREQDLGIPGLRKAKESYHPVKMIEKYRIRNK